MSVGTKNRLSQIGTQCKAHLREQHADQSGLVEEFISEIEGLGKDQDANRWTQFTDSKRSVSDMLARVDAAFEKWLNP